ncbi:hypothetical protein FRB96_002790 [Tulasnella sp. 330]|nr:hypothetical protein FRB96_002790 [Tulasnella sp. 330]KAG8873188.1 hypothetical protein FRB98_009169 [Tulasnella sp. 332]
MAPRATQQSRASQGKKKGSGASQHARRADDSDENDSEDANDDEQEGDGDEDEDMAGGEQAGSQKKGKKPNKGSVGGSGSGGGGTLSDEVKRTHLDELQRLSKNIVRLALSMTGKRAKLTRSDINAHALPPKSKAFNAAFIGAQKILRNTFGMELVEMMSRTERDKLGEEAPREEGGAKRKSQASSKSYVLRSTLPPALIKVASAKDNDLLTAEIQDLRDLGLVGDNEDDDAREGPLGSLLAWKSVESLALTGVLQLILCLILVNGRSIPEPQLKNQLKHFHLHWSSSFPMPAHHTEKEITLDAYLTRMKNEEMLDYITVSTMGGGGATQASATQHRRKSRVTADEGQVVEWKWGVRAHAEISEESVAQFMTSFMKTQWKDEQEALLAQDEDDEAAGGANPQKKNKQKGTFEERREELKAKADKYGATVYKDIVRAAGGSLTEIKPVA